MVEHFIKRRYHLFNVYYTSMVVWIDLETKIFAFGQISYSGIIKIEQIYRTTWEVYIRGKWFLKIIFRDLDLSENWSLCTSVRLAHIRLNRLKHDTFSSLPVDLWKLHGSSVPYGDWPCGSEPSNFTPSAVSLYDYTLSPEEGVSCWPCAFRQKDMRLASRYVGAVPVQTCYKPVVHM